MFDAIAAVVSTLFLLACCAGPIATYAYDTYEVKYFGIWAVSKREWFHRHFIMALYSLPVLVIIPWFMLHNYEKRQAEDLLRAEQQRANAAYDAGWSQPYVCPTQSLVFRLNIIDGTRQTLSTTRSRTLATPPAHPRACPETS